MISEPILMLKFNTCITRILALQELGLSGVSALDWCSSSSTRGVNQKHCRVFILRNYTLVSRFPCGFTWFHDISSFWSTQQKSLALVLDQRLTGQIKRFVAHSEETNTNMQKQAPRNTDVRAHHKKTFVTWVEFNDFWLLEIVYKQYQSIHNVHCGFTTNVLLRFSITDCSGSLFPQRWHGFFRVSAGWPAFLKHLGCIKSIVSRDGQ